MTNGNGGLIPEGANGTTPNSKLPDRKIRPLEIRPDVPPGQVESYIRNLDPKVVAQARKLNTSDNVLDALPEEVLNLSKIKKKLPKYMDMILASGLTDVDLAKLKDFIPITSSIPNGLAGNADDSLRTFTQYLGAVIPAKIGKDLDGFVEFGLNHASARNVSSLRGPMFEKFLKVHVPGFQGLSKARFPKPGSKNGIQPDAFDPSTGTLWDFKFQTKPLEKKHREKYVDVLEKTAEEGGRADKVNFVFATKEQAAQNKTINSLPNHQVYYVDQQQPGGAINLIPL